MDEVQKGIGNKISAEVAKHCAPALEALTAGPASGAQPPSQASKLTGRREEAYQHARRSLKVWPVEGDDLEEALKVFCKTRLKIRDDRIANLGSIMVLQVTSRVARERKEVLATFENREDRDFIKAQGTSLAEQKEAGMAIQVPGHLMDNLASLNGLAYSVKQKNPGLKRSVKFDDAVQDIYLDMCISGN